MEGNIENDKNKICPVCNKDLILHIELYWCHNCEKWFEDIDFLDSEDEIDEDCKICKWLSETAFKRNDLTVFYCNNLKSNRKMVKFRDFRKCSEFKNRETEDDKVD